MGPLYGLGLGCVQRAGLRVEHDHRVNAGTSDGREEGFRLGVEGFEIDELCDAAEQPPQGGVRHCGNAEREAVLPGAMPAEDDRPP